MSTFSFSSFLLKEDERESRRKENKEERATAVSLGALEKRLFRIKCSDRFSSLRRDCGGEPHPQIRQYRICSST